MKRTSDGYLKTCKYCDDTIYMKNDGRWGWRPYESWKEDQVDRGEWELHRCSFNSNTNKLFT